MQQFSVLVVFLTAACLVLASPISQNPQNRNQVRRIPMQIATPTSAIAHHIFPPGLITPKPIVGEVKSDIVIAVQETIIPNDSCLSSWSADHSDRFQQPSQETIIPAPSPVKPTSALNATSSTINSITSPTSHCTHYTLYMDTLRANPTSFVFSTTRFITSSLDCQGCRYLDLIPSWEGGAGGGDGHSIPYFHTATMSGTGVYTNFVCALSTTTSGATTTNTVESVITSSTKVIGLDCLNCS